LCPHLPCCWCIAIQDSTSSRLLPGSSYCAYAHLFCAEVNLVFFERHYLVCVARACHGHLCCAHAALISFTTCLCSSWAMNVQLLLLLLQIRTQPHLGCCLAAVTFKRTLQDLVQTTRRALKGLSSHQEVKGRASYQEEKDQAKRAKDCQSILRHRKAACQVWATSGAVSYCDIRMSTRFFLHLDLWQGLTGLSQLMMFVQY
jgi:hypothetical protein